MTALRYHSGSTGRPGAGVSAAAVAAAAARPAGVFDRGGVRVLSTRSLPSRVRLRVIGYAEWMRPGRTAAATGIRAPEGRQNVAHGVSRGWPGDAPPLLPFSFFQAPEGRQKAACGSREAFCRPSGAW